MAKTRFAFLILLLVSLAACQPAAPAAQQPIPLTGARASALGASVLTLQRINFEPMLKLVPLLAATGKPTPGYASIELGREVSQYTFSADREEMILLSRGASGCKGSCLRLLNLRTWKETIQPIPVPIEFTEGWVSGIAYDPGRQLAAIADNSAYSQHTQVILVNLKQGKALEKTELDLNVYQIGFTPRGELAVYGTPTSLGPDTIGRVLLLDGASLKTIWTQDLEDIKFGSEPPGGITDPSQGRYLSPAVTSTPDHSRLYIVAADADRLVTVDFDRRAVHSASIAPQKSWIDRLVEATAGVAQAKMMNGTSKTAVLAADGKTLYVIGQTTTTVKDKNGDYSMQFTPLGMQVVDAASGTLLDKLETGASNIQLSPDGETLLLTDWGQTDQGNSKPHTDLVTAKDLKVVSQLDGEVSPTRLLDGSLAWLTTDWLSDQSWKMEVILAGESTPKFELKGKEPNSITWVVVP